LGAVIAMAYIIIIAVLLPGYIPWTSVNFILGMAGLPLTIVYGGRQPSSFRFYIVAVVLVLLAVVVREQCLVLFAVVAAMLAIAEGVWGRLSLLSLLTLCFMSPTVQYLSGVFSFPVRMWLTSVAGHMLSFTGKAAGTAGNVITYAGHDYSVDPACMGLKMLLTSFLFGLFIIAIYQKRYLRYLQWPAVLSLLSVVFALNVLSNIIRILVLVYFDIGPDSAMHGAVGLICLVIYVLLPLGGIAAFVARRFGQPHAEFTLPAHGLRPARLVPVHACFIALIILATTGIHRERNAVWGIEPPLVSGYTASRYNEEVLQYKNERALVYIKPIKGPLHGEHNPVMCWLGSGYEFERMGESRINGVQLMTGTLKKGNTRLYTAWWYDNGASRTTSQARWRWLVFNGDRQYSIINVTAADQAALEAAVMEINRENTFKAVL
jgi:exosortase N